MAFRIPGELPAALRRRVGTTRGLMLLAVVVGALAGGGAIGFRYLILGLTQAFSGYHDFSGVGPAPNPHIPLLGHYWVALAPIAGGLLYGPLVARFAPEARGHGVPEVMYAVAERGGRIRPRVPAVKALASALCIGSGGSVGREGPIVQIGSALGSIVGRLTAAGVGRTRLLVACGAAGGISATFNAPIAGVFFALEVILRDFETRSFGVVVLSSVTAAAVGRAAFGEASFLHLPAFSLHSPLEFVLYALLGALAGAVGVLFIRVLYGGEDLADRLWRGPAWARPAVGGVLLGGLLLAVPQMYGVGYPVLTRAVGGHYVVTAALGLLLAKVAATSLTIAIGGSGGVFAPALFMGGMLGTAFGQLAGSILPGVAAPSGAYAIVGMGAVFSGAARAPITAVLIIFELTGDYAVILPMMLAIAVAAEVSGRLSADTIYTLKLRRRGIHVDRPRVVSVMRTVTVGAAMGVVPGSIPASAGPDEILRLLAGEHTASAPVSDGSRFVGVVRAADAEREAIAGGSRVASELARDTGGLRGEDSLEEAIGELSAADDAGLPVFGDGEGEVAGWITHSDVLRAYHRERERLSAPA